LHRLLWKLGAKTPPPHFLGFTANFVSAGVWFGVAWGFADVVYCLVTPGYVALRRVCCSTFAGVFFGLCMAAYYRYGARKHRIPLWREFHPPDDART
jgi:hypothetical protein